jgi:hypothetical protein
MDGIKEELRTLNLKMDKLIEAHGANKVYRMITWGNFVAWVGFLVWAVQEKLKG